MDYEIDPSPFLLYVRSVINSGKQTLVYFHFNELANGMVFVTGICNTLCYLEPVHQGAQLFSEF